MSQTFPPPLPQKTPFLPPPIPNNRPARRARSFAMRSDFVIAVCQLFLFAVVLTGVGGAFGDFARPIFPVNLILCVGSAAALVIFSLLFVAFRRQGFGVVCFCLLCVTVGFGTWWVLSEHYGSRSRGYLAKHVVAVGELQQSVWPRQTKLALEAEEEFKQYVEKRTHVEPQKAELGPVTLEQKGLRLVEWRGGAIEEFIARMRDFSKKDHPTVISQFDPKRRIANYFSKTDHEFFARFGEPFQDEVDFEKAPSGAPAFIREQFRIWRYQCFDGILTLRVQPTQDRSLLITAHLRDNPN